MSLRDIHHRKILHDALWRAHAEAVRRHASGTATISLSVKYSPDQPRDWHGRWTNGDGQTAFLEQGGRGGGGGGGGGGGSRRVCQKLDGVSIDGIICLYRCPDGSIRRYPNPFPICTNVIFNYESY